MRITVEIEGEVQLERDLEKYSARGEDLETFFEHFTDWFHDHEAKQFESEGMYASAGWAPLSPRYAMWKHRVWPGKLILERQGKLKRSLTSRAAGGIGMIPGRGGVVDIDRGPGGHARGVFVGTDVEYAKFHQWGTRNMPRRRSVELRERDRRDIVKALQRFIIRKEGDPAPFPGIPFNDPFAPLTPNARAHGKLFKVPGYKPTTPFNVSGRGLAG